MCVFFMVGTAKSTGMFLPEFQEYFNIPTSLAAMLMGGSAIVYAGLGKCCCQNLMRDVPVCCVLLQNWDNCVSEEHEQRLCSDNMMPLCVVFCCKIRLTVYQSIMNEGHVQTA